MIYLCGPSDKIQTNIQRAHFLYSFFCHSPIPLDNFLSQHLLPFALTIHTDEQAKQTGTQEGVKVQNSQPHPTPQDNKNDHKHHSLNLCLWHFNQIIKVFLSREKPYVLYCKLFSNSNKMLFIHLYSRIVLQRCPDRKWNHLLMIIMCANKNNKNNNSNKKPHHHYNFKAF